MEQATRIATPERNMPPQAARNPKTDTGAGKFTLLFTKWHMFFLAS
jgi:hypothetical protein